MTGSHGIRSDLVSLSAVVGRAVLDRSGEHDTLVHVQWCRPDVTVAIQVYVDGDLADVVIDPEQHDSWLILDRALIHNIELVAIPLYDGVDLWAKRAASDNVDESAVTSRIEVALLRDETLPIDTRVGVRLDGATLDSAALWSESDPRSGFGGLFGIGVFGRDAASGPGLGRGELGYGPLGIDSTAWRWRSPPLQPGEHTIELEPIDAAEKPIALATDFGQITTAVTPSPASQVLIDRDFILSWDD